MELQVMVRAPHGRVILASFAADVIDTVLVAAKDAMPPVERHAPNVERCRYLAERMDSLLRRELTPQIGQAIAAMALLYAWLDPRQGAGAREMIENALEDGETPLLAVGIVGRACVSCVSVNHERAAAQLKFLVERLSAGDAGFIRH